MSISRLPDWRRESCSERCWRKPVLVIGERGKQIIEWHDVDAHEAWARNEVAAPVVETGPLRIDRRRCSLTVDGRRAGLTPTEYAILVYLAGRLGEVCSHASILEAVWGPAYVNDAHLLRVNVARVRKSLGYAREMIVGHFGFGYRLLALAPGMTASDEPPVVMPRVFRQGPRQETIMRALESAPERRLSFEQLVVEAYGHVDNQSRKLTWVSIESLDRYIPALHFERGRRLYEGLVWLEDAQP